MNEEKLDRVIELLEEILNWTRFEGNQRVEEVLLDTLNTDAKKIAYELSDGRSSPEIAKVVGVHPHTIRDWWKEWAKRMLTEVLPNKRYRKVFSLDDFGIEVPKAKKEEKTVEPAETSEESEDENGAE